MRMPTPADLEMLRAAPVTPIMISGPDMLCLLSILQLALCHPGVNNSAPATVARIFAEAIEKRIVDASPRLKDLCAAGWNPEFDVTTIVSPQRGK